jgi:hypothetical protein
MIGLAPWSCPADCWPLLRQKLGSGSGIKGTNKGAWLIESAREGWLAVAAHE